MDTVTGGCPLCTRAEKCFGSEVFTRNGCHCSTHAKGVWNLWKKRQREWPSAQWMKQEALHDALPACCAGFLAFCQWLRQLRTDVGCLSKTLVTFRFESLSSAGQPSHCERRGTYDLKAADHFPFLFYYNDIQNSSKSSEMNFEKLDVHHLAR